MKKTQPKKPTKEITQVSTSRGIFNKLIQSMDLSDKGFSFRKILSLTVMILIAYIHFEYVTSANVLTAILYDFGFIAVLLGLVNVDRLIDAKYGKKDDHDHHDDDYDDCDNDDYDHGHGHGDHGHGRGDHGRDDYYGQDNNCDEPPIEEAPRHRR